MKKKVLLMGKSGAGKTSMRSIIFANYVARETTRLGPTLDVEHSHVRFMGNLVLNLWDCGGQDVFYDNYFTSQRDHIFLNVELLIYVFDVERDGDDFEKDLQKYEECIEAIEENSPSTKVFILVHKMDRAGDTLAEQMAKFRLRSDQIRSRSRSMVPTFFATSIWDETLYQAWSAIVYAIIPDIAKLEKHLQTFCEISDASEVVLFERSTFLVITKAASREHHDPHRFEKISNIIKQFKLSCSSSTKATFGSMEISNSRFTAFIESFTESTFIMVIMARPTPEIFPAATKLNLKLALKFFEKFVHLLGESKESS